MDDRMMDNEVANPFKILSAYLITAAITSPPRAFRKKIIRKQLIKYSKVLVKQ